MRKFLRTKIHRATVTHADLDYEGSITLSPELLEASGIRPYEAVNVWNVTNGQRFETYAIAGEAGTSDICVNGAAAHLVSPGDIVIIAAFTFRSEEEAAEDFQPIVVFVDERNRVREIAPEMPGPRRAVRG